MSEKPTRLKAVVTSYLKEVAEKLDKGATDCDYFLKKHKEDYEQETLDFFKKDKQEHREAAEYVRGLIDDLWK
jgi:hypothetical protein